METAVVLADNNWLGLNARNAFADLFFCDTAGRIFRLDVAAGKLTRIADSEAQFRQVLQTQEKREQWFAESHERTARSTQTSLILGIAGQTARGRNRSKQIE